MKQPKAKGRSNPRQEKHLIQIRLPIKVDLNKLWFPKKRKEKEETVGSICVVFSNCDKIH